MKRKATIAFSGFISSLISPKRVSINYRDLELGNELWKRVRVPGSSYKSLTSLQSAVLQTPADPSPRLNPSADLYRWIVRRPVWDAPSVVDRTFTSPRYCKNTQNITQHQAVYTPSVNDNKKAELSQRWPRDAPYVWVPWKFSGVPDNAHGYFSRNF